MGLSGNIRDLSLANMMQVLCVSGQTGILMMRDGDQCAEIVFRHGKIASARAALPADLSCDWLVGRCLLDKDRLDQALDRVAAGQMQETVAGVLVNQFGIDPKRIAVEAKKEFERALGALLCWTGGTYSFASCSPEKLAGQVRTPYVLLLAEGIVPGGLKRAEPASQAVAEPMPANTGLLEADRSARDRVADIPSSACETPGKAADFSEIEMPAAQGTVFLVDDDPRIREGFAGAFSVKGWQIEIFDRGADLLAGLARALDRGLQPLLLIDLVMPRLSGEGILGGLEMLRVIRSRHPDLTVRMFSDYFCAETEKEIQALGVGKLLLKPHRRQIADGGDGAMAAFVEQVAAILPSSEQKAPRAPETDRASKAGASGRSAREEDPLLRQLQLLKTLTTELRAHDLGEQIWLLVLRFAADLFDRAVIFSVADGLLRGVGQFGFEGFGRFRGGSLGEDPLSPGGAGLFDAVLQNRTSQIKRLAAEEWERTFGAWPGGPPAGEIFLGPIVCDDKVVAILYGDTALQGGAMGEMTALEVFLAEAGLVLERIAGNGRWTAP